MALYLCVQFFLSVSLSLRIPSHGEREREREREGGQDSSDEWVPVHRAPVHLHFSVIFFKFRRETTFVTYCLCLWMTKPFTTEAYFKRQEFAPAGANAFL